jgi:hypothetical protein
MISLPTILSPIIIITTISITHSSNQTNRFNPTFTMETIKVREHPQSSINNNTNKPPASRQLRR